MVYLPRGSIMQWNGNDITEHNRQELNISKNRIGDRPRMVDGTMRSWYVADKREISCSWEGVPNLTNSTVDKKWGASAMEDFYEATTGPFTLSVRNGQGVVETIVVEFTDFSSTISKRGVADLMDVSVSMEEV